MSNHRCQTVVRIARRHPCYTERMLAALVPKPRVILPRYDGVFAPNSKQRARVTLAKRGKGSKRKACDAGQEKTPTERRALMSLKRSA